MGKMRALVCLAAAIGICGGLAAPVFAADTAVTVIAGTPQDFAVVQRVARALDHQGGLRVLPIDGKGPVQALTDLIEIDGVDAAVVASDTLTFIDRNGLLAGAGDKLAYIIRLAPLDVHVIARGNINVLADLAGKTVAVAPASSQSYVAGQLLLGAVGAAAKTVEVNSADAVRAVASGAADAAILVGRKPLPELAALTSASGIHLVDVAAPSGLEDVYAPSLVTNADYPQLVTAAKPVETVSTALLIAAAIPKKGSEQYDKMKLFAGGLFGVLQPGGEGGANLNLAALVPGWNRLKAADEALAQHASQVGTASQTGTEN